jgi:hypothetical protein
VRWLRAIILLLSSGLFFLQAALRASPKAQANQNSADAATQQSHDNDAASPNAAGPGGGPRPEPPNSSDASRPPKPNKTGVPVPESIAPAHLASEANRRSGAAILKICIRNQDDSPFSGVASVHVVSGLGSEATGKNSDTEEGETEYSDLPAGAYSIQVSAPGFLAVKQTVEVESGKRTQTAFMILKPDLPVADPRATTAIPASTNADKTDRTSIQSHRRDRWHHAWWRFRHHRPSDATSASVTSWVPASIDAYKPIVVPSVSCSLPTVQAGVSQRMKQFVANLQKFSATEHIEHYPIDLTGKRLTPQTRTFDYVVQVTTLPGGGSFSIDEYRNGGFDRTRFPANIATEGVSAMVLIFHPVLALDFDFQCEGLENFYGRPAWLVRFKQREDRPSQIGGYRTLEHYYPFVFKGLAWIDAGSYQVLRLETELAKPIPEVGLTEEIFIINYGSVAFHSRKQQLWLPQSAELYMQRHSSRFYRIHTFSDFKIYTVDTDQSIHAPKEAYCFTNTSDHDIAGMLTVTPTSGISLNAISIRFIVPPGKSVYKSVGLGKDISIPVNDVGSATFTHNGSADAIKADAYLVRESTLDVIADTPIPINP